MNIANSNNYLYTLNFYDFDLVSYGNHDIDQLNDFNQGYRIFSKCYHIKDRYAIFIYFKGTSASILKVQIVTIANTYDLTTILVKEINEYSLNTNVLLNDFIKINEQRFALLTFK